MFKDIIVGVGERESRDDAIMLARELAAPDAVITLGRVCQSLLAFGAVLTLQREREEYQQAEQVINEVRDASGIQSVAVWPAMSPGRGLHELVEQAGADLLVIGSTHRGLLDRVSMGSDTRDAINGLPCAVAVAPTAYAASEPAIHKVGVAYDESPEAEDALAVARDIAAAHDAQVAVMEVARVPAYGYSMLGAPYAVVKQEIRKEAQERLARLEGVEKHVVIGDTADELAEFSATVDLLVVGSRGYGPLGRVVHSSATMELARKARCPLLILPRGNEVSNESDDAEASAAAVS